MALILTSPTSDVVSVVATPTSDWVKHPTRPELNTAAALTVVSERTRSRTQGVFAPLGSDAEIVVSDTKRRLPRGSISYLARDAATVARLDALWDTGDTLLVQIPGPRGEVGENVWLQVIGDVTTARLEQAPDDDRTISVSFTGQNRPA